MLTVTKNGITEALSDYRDLERTREVNGEISLSFLLFKTERNAHSFDLVAEESIITLKGQDYRIKKMERMNVRTEPIKKIEAHHVFFDLIDNFIYDEISGTKTIQQALTHALSGSGYTFDVIDAFNSVPVGDAFGKDNSLALVGKTLDLFGAEVQRNNKNLTIKQKVGVNSGFQFRYGYNVQTITEDIDTSNLATYIKGFGKKDEETGAYLTTAEYTSPNVSVFGVRHAPPVYDERFTIQAHLLDEIKKRIQDTPEVSITLTFAEMKKAGYPYDVIDEGDTLYLIHEPLGIDIEVRCLQIRDYPDDDDPRGSAVTLANIKRTLTDVTSDFKDVSKKLREMIDVDAVIRYNVLPEAVKRATESIMNASTELEFPTSGGIVGRSKENPNHLTVFNSNGFGISRDGGQNFTEAVTADGFVLSVGAIGELSANNIDVSGIINLINSGGFTAIDGGKIAIGMNQDFKDLDLDVQTAINNAQTALQEAQEAQGLANDAFIQSSNAKNTVDLWKYPNTTYINGGQIFSNTVTANQLNVSRLSAISSDMGSITAGNINISSDLRVGNNIYLGEYANGFKKIIMNSGAFVQSAGSFSLDLSASNTYIKDGNVFLGSSGTNVYTDGYLNVRGGHNIVAKFG